MLKIERKKILTLIIFLGGMISFGVLSCIGVNFTNGNSSIGSMYFDEANEKLLFGGKNGGIYIYDIKENKSRAIIKKAEKNFGVEEDQVIYTFRNEKFSFDLSEETSVKIEDFSEDVEILFSDVIYNKKEVTDLLKKTRK